MVTETGEIVEIFFTPGRWNDVQGLRSYRSGGRCSPPL